MTAPWTLPQATGCPVESSPSKRQPCELLNYSPSNWLLCGLFSKQVAALRTLLQATGCPVDSSPASTGHACGF
eukprot:355077-Chlamydomonas_euryale.AAC.8